MVKNRLEKIISNDGILNEKYYGFVKHRSAIECVNHLISVIKEKQIEGFRVMSVFIDLEDAFNNVNLNSLQAVMNRMGIPKQYVNWIAGCFKEREISVDTVRGKKTMVSTCPAMEFRKVMC